MATKTLRPSSDSSISHSRSSGSNAHSLISETTSDGDSTYIYQNVSGTSSTTVSSTVGFDILFPSASYTVSACRLYFLARRSAAGTASATVTFKVNNSGNYTVQATSLGTSYTSYNATSTDMANAINQALSSGTIPNITVTIQTKGNLSSSKDSSFNIRVTQVYLEIDYAEVVQSTEAFFVKEDGQWKKYRTAYKKVNGSWVQQNDLGSVVEPNVKYRRG